MHVCAYVHACLDEGMPLALLLESHWQPGCCQAGLEYSVLTARHASWHQLEKQKLAHAINVAGVSARASGKWMYDSVLGVQHAWVCQ